MEITIKGTEEMDFPNIPKENREQVLKEMEEAVRKRLELREKDTVNINIKFKD